MTSPFNFEFSILLNLLYRVAPGPYTRNMYAEQTKHLELGDQTTRDVVLRAAPKQPEMERYLNIFVT